MIIDVNAHLGHYPFRKVRFTSATAMVEHMDAHAIDVAVVSSLHAVFYRDSHQGNLELFEAARRYPERLAPVATVNPTYVGWMRDLEESVTHHGAKGVTLFPAHHGYSLTDELGQVALKHIVQYELPLVLTQRLEDRRQRHRWDEAEDLTVDTLTEVALAHPTLRFVLSNWRGLEAPQLAAARLKDRCLIDFARMHVLMRKEIPELIAALGVESIAFGSHIPFDYVGPSLVKLANLKKIAAPDYERIAFRNAAEFFKIEVSGNPVGKSR